MIYKDSISSLRFKGYLSDNIYFAMNSEFNRSEDDLELDLEFNYDLNMEYEEKRAILNLECTVFDNCEENNYPFTIDVSLLGFFEFDGDLKEEDVHKMIEINGSAILFPYLRSIISNITASAGIQPLIIPTMNISKLIKNDINKTEL